ncbi:Purine-cytosine permease [Hyphodiscus hymeniophilus]|uniref:Purine-cytosine permease n=1 Tax=Hyphodiscus hymeniophilus TaxID=353542 RepID=A0A9P7AW39_9HELO|nr:Purine-cytosine permease [Hyphodiscus hymeniophilus]
MSANVGVATLAFGTLGPALFELGWWDSFLCILFFNIIGSMPPALMATFGPKLGLRTMVMPRYSFGWYPAKGIAIINLLNQIGWAMVNAIAGAQFLYDVGNGNLPMSVAVLIVGLLAMVIGMFGYKHVHRFERVSWLVVLVCLIIVTGFGAKHMVNVPMGKGPAETSSILSFGTTIIGFQISWAPIAADYGVFMRETYKPRSVFLWSFCGLFISQFFVELLGVGLMTAVNGSDAFQNAYDAAGVGGLTGEVFKGHGAGVAGFGKFIQVILGFSVLGVVIVNLYSLGLNVQAIGLGLLDVPRLVWSLLGGAIFLAAAVAGRNHLSSVMENFLNVVAYWLTPFLTIIFLEHIIWRRGFAYDVSAWQNPKKLPHGFAAAFCFITWWVGPIALAVGNPPFGTDISWELALGATTLLYVPLRWLERKKFGL